MTKHGLYKKVHNIRESLGIDLAEYPIRIKEYIGDTTNITTAPFETPGLRGIAISNGIEVPQIILNSNLSINESNFYCGHEFMHIMLHPPKSHSTFTCYERVREQQNTFLEWQANEGAAELLMPYQLLIPEYVSLKKRMLSGFWPYEGDIFDVLAENFHTTYMIAQHRISSLSYEIQQYENGISLDRLKIVSKSALVARGISVFDESEIARKICCFYDFSA